MPTTVPPAAPPKPADAPAERSIGFEEFVDKRIGQTRAAVKSADLAAGLGWLLAGGLAYLLAAAVAEHWFVRGGYTATERYALFGIGMLGAAVYAAGRLLPIALGRVNPLYAAREIERDAPSLKNSLVNLLQLRDPQTAPTAVRETLEQQAAAGLATTGETAVDRTPLVHSACLVLSVVVAIGLYAIISPKSFLASAGRVAMPWSSIVAPTRVRVESLEPGATTLAQGERLDVGAMVTGLDEGERVEVVYSTEDGRIVDRRTAMVASQTGVHHSATLPPGSAAERAMGAQGDFRYRLEAGDARTPDFAVRVLASPTIAPVRVRYDYPAYTGYASREVEATGDLSALEGTRVTLSAQANLDIDSAQIDLRADGRPDVRMRVDGRQAEGRFAMPAPGGGSSRETGAYVIKFTSVDGQANHSPPTYRYESIADLPPEAAVLSPEQPVTEVAIDQTLEIVLEARDPDFALQRLRLVGKSKGRQPLRRELLKEPHSGRWRHTERIQPKRLGLRPGDTLDFWIEAQDNKSPEPNLVSTRPRQLVVVGPTEPGDAQSEQGQGAAEGDPTDNRDPDPNQPGSQEQQGQKGDGSQEGQSQQERPSSNQAGGERDGDQEIGDRPQPEDPPQQEGEGRKPSPDGIQGAGDESQASGQEENSSGGGDPTDGSSGDQPKQGNQSGDGGAAGGQAPTNSQPNEGGSGGERRDQNPDGQDRQSPVATDGSDDGAAFERILEHLDEQGNNKPDRGEGQAQDNQQPGARGDESDAASEADSPRARNELPESPDRDRPPQAGEESGDSSGDASDSQSSDPGSPTPPQPSANRTSAPREGAGESGQNQAADQGDGQSGDRGPGESSDRPGEDQAADGPTGRSGDEPGEGSRSRATDRQTPGDGNDAGNENDPNRLAEKGANPENAPSGESGETGDAERDTNGGANDSNSRRGDGAEGDSPSDAQSMGNSSNSRDGSSPPGRDPRRDRAEAGDRGDRRPDKSDRGDGASDKADPTPGETLGGRRGDRQSDTAIDADHEMGGDDANLEYARKQTELVLDRLEERLAESEADRSLLEKLGWTEKDLRRFIDRWRGRQDKDRNRSRDQPGTLNEALRSLGLKPQGKASRRETTDDDLRDLNERARTSVPPRLRDSLRWYTRGVNESSGGQPESTEE